MAVVQLGMVNENGRERRVFKRRGRAGLMSVKGIKVFARPLFNRGG